MSGLTIALLLIILWILMAIVLQKRKVLERYNMSLFGPTIMWRTERGKSMIDRIARRRGMWKRFGDAAIAICCFFMFAMLGLLLWQATFVRDIPKESAPTPQMVLGIPGINPFIPLWYGILGFAVAIAVHEICHGILARVADVKVKSLGLLLFIFPIGAFMEPDEEALEKVDRAPRSRVYAIGPVSNIVVAFICALLFSCVMMSSVDVASPGTGIIGITEGGPADIAGFERGMMITGIGDTKILDAGDFVDAMNGTQAGQTIEFTLFKKGEPELHLNLTTGYNWRYEQLDDKEWYSQEQGFLGITGENSSGQGARVTSVFYNSPADGIGLEEGDLIVELDNTTITDMPTLRSIVSGTHGGQTVTVRYLENGTGEEIAEEVKLGISKGWLGVYVTSIDLGRFQSFLQHPFENVDRMQELPSTLLLYISLPIIGLSPIQEPLTDFYVINGWLSGLSEGQFWVLANSIYWIFWLNIMLGLTNSLPMVPFDGGAIFKDGLDYTIERARPGMKAEKRRGLAGGISVIMAFLVLGLILWQFIGPRV